MKNKTGFTLSEVLITLGIIGIVAALTLPALTANYKKKEYTVRLKRFYSTMQQAIQMSGYNNESAIYWQYPNNNIDEMENFWQTYFAPYFKSVIKTERKPSSSGRNTFVVYFQDGSSVDFNRGGVIDFHFDVNADKKPNAMGKDQFTFLLHISSGRFTPYGWQGDIDNINEASKPDIPFTTNMNDRDNVKRLCKRDVTFCSQLLWLDGWEFKEDYPY